MGRPWFKHFANASEGASIRSLIDSRHLDTIAIYWMILECLCRFEDNKKPGSMLIAWATLCRVTGCRRPALRSHCARIASVSLMQYEDVTDMLVRVDIPKWLELQSQYARSQRHPKGISPVEDRREKKEEREKEIARVDKNQIREAIEEWGKTLKHYKLTRDPRMDDHTIARLVAARGLEKTKKAIEGMRYELASKNYNPADNCDLHRLSNQRSFDRLLNIYDRKPNLADSGNYFTSIEEFERRHGKKD